MNQSGSKIIIKYKKDMTQRFTINLFNSRLNLSDMIHFDFREFIHRLRLGAGQAKLLFY